MAKVRNILFIMCDPLRRDYLSGYSWPARIFRAIHSCKTAGLGVE
jgi:arylsulfatase A-like enzyme